jgi:hypothetical protein
MRSWAGHATRMVEMEIHTLFKSENLKVRTHLRDVDVEGIT